MKMKMIKAIILYLKKLWNIKKKIILNKFKNKIKKMDIYLFSIMHVEYISFFKDYFILFLFNNFLCSDFIYIYYLYLYIY